MWWHRPKRSVTFRNCPYQAKSLVTVFGRSSWHSDLNNLTFQTWQSCNEPGLFSCFGESLKTFYYSSGLDLTVTVRDERFVHRALLGGADTQESSASSGVPEWNKRERIFSFVKRTPYTTLLHSQSPLKLFLWNVTVCSMLASCFTPTKKQKR